MVFELDYIILRETPKRMLALAGVLLSVSILLFYLAFYLDPVVFLIRVYISGLIGGMGFLLIAVIISGYLNRKKYSIKEGPFFDDDLKFREA